MSIKHLTPLDLIKAIDALTDAEKETFVILADEKLSEEILKRRKNVLNEMKNGQLLDEKELFDKK